MTTRILIGAILMWLFAGDLSATTDSLPVWNAAKVPERVGDWLLGDIGIRAGVYRSSDGKDLILYNGLVKRSFRLTPNLACTDFINMVNGQQLLRSLRPEARIGIDGRDHEIGGLEGLKEHAYFRKEWLDGLHASDSGFRYESYTIGNIAPRFERPAGFWSAGRRPSTGKSVTFNYRSTLPEISDILVSVHYELYDGIPLIAKWISLENRGTASRMISRPVHEILALVEEESAVVGKPEQMKKQHGIYVETNYAFNNAMRYDISDQTTHWLTDSLYRSQVNYNYETPCVLEIYPEKVTGIRLASGERFTSARSYELLMDSYDRERRGLAIRKMYRTVAPWVTENPIFMHLVSRNDDEVRQAIEQCAATGYEALILSFGSHCNLEDTSAGNIRRWKALADLAHSRNIRIGGYALFSSRRISDEDDVIDPVSGKPDAGAFFGHAPCMGSRWGLEWLGKLRHFFTATGFDIFENDGPYPGDVCASVKHPGHEGLHDSQWRQMALQKDLYKWLHERGVYINSPDWYFLDGSNKIAIGYRETNFSLSRDQQKILNRQNIHDGLWEKIPSMGWGFVPLVKYQGGGPEAVLEPLSEHLADYEQLMVQYYGAGVQACYRGPRLYDTEKTRETVIRTIRWYKKYRDILNADIIHLRRADGRDWDGILHADPALPQKGLLMLYNPLGETIQRKIRVPVYYTGLRGHAMVREREGVSRKVPVDADHGLSLSFTIPPGGYTWFVLESP